MFAGSIVSSTLLGKPILMSAFNYTVLWLADFHVMATALLACALVAMALMKQPARRMAVAKASLAALAALAFLCALPGWSAVHLASQQRRTPVEDSLVVPIERPVTQVIPHINVDKIPAAEEPLAPMAPPRVVAPTTRHVRHAARRVVIS